MSAPIRPVKPQSWRRRKLAEMKASKHSYILLAPYMILFTLFTVFPVVISMILSFTYFNMLEFPRFEVRR